MDEMKSEESLSPSLPKKNGNGITSSDSSSSKAMKKTKKKEIKRFLKAELKKEISPLIIGSIAMLCSTVSNQGMLYLFVKYEDINVLLAVCSISLHFLVLLFLYYFFCSCPTSSWKST